MQNNFEIEIPKFLILDEDKKHNSLNFDLLENKVIIGFLGYSKSGKDAIANRFVKKYEFQRIAFADNTIGKVINIGNDFEISINDLAKKVIAETNSKSEIVYVPYEEAYGDGFEDMERRVPNIELIKTLVGWEPQRNLSSMISDIADFLHKS